MGLSRFRLWILLALSIFCRISSAEDEEVWNITTLEWPPFTCEACPEQGSGAKVLREALGQAGVKVRFVFLPWSRAIREAKAEPYVGYYPVWPEDVQEGFISSDTLYRSPIGFVERVDNPIRWKVLEDLKGLTIGIVQDYGNTREFNDLVARKEIIGDVVMSDDINVRKVGGGHLRAAVIDENNLKYLLLNQYKKYRDVVQFNKVQLANKDLVLALTASGGIEKIRAEKLNRAFKKIDAQKIVDDFNAKLFRKSK